MTNVLNAQALDGFIIILSSNGKILYLSESVTSLLGYLSVSDSILNTHLHLVHMIPKTVKCIAINRVTLSTAQYTSTCATRRRQNC